MTPETLAALKGSIAKWQGVVQGTVQDLGTFNCPLCELFYENSCKGCPVRDRTGSTECDDTPYRIFVVAKGDSRKIAAQAELDFLISLLPEGEMP